MRHIIRRSSANSGPQTAVEGHSLKDFILYNYYGRRIINLTMAAVRPKHVVYWWCYFLVKYIFFHSCVLTIFYFILYYCKWFFDFQNFTTSDSLCWLMLLECISFTPWRWSLKGWNMLELRIVLIKWWLSNILYECICGCLLWCLCNIFSPKK
jgi:hypothetical protein